jgi:hypothetical protein
MNTASSSIAKAIFILKLDENGNFSWAKKIDNTSNSGGFPTYGYSIASDHFDGSVYCGGVFQSTTPYDFDPNTGQFLVIGTSAASNGFLLKLDVNGNFNWVRTFVPNTTKVVPVDIAVLEGSSRDVYTMGYFLGQVNFNLNSSAPGTLYSGNSSSTFVTRYEMDGDFKWAKQPESGPGSVNEGSSCSGWGSIEAFEHGGFSKIWFTGAFFDDVVDMNPEVNTYLLNNNGTSSPDGFVTEWNENLYGKGVKSLSTSEAKNIVYPNPSNEVVNIGIDSESVSTLQVSNSRGELIDVDVIVDSGVVQITLSNHPVGVYLVKYILDDKVFVERLVIID